MFSTEADTGTSDVTKAEKQAETGHEQDHDDQHHEG